MAFAIHLSGAVALLIFSVRMIRTGVERGFMGQIRGVLRSGEGNRTASAGAGAFAAALLQSSTAVAMLVASFAAASTLRPAIGLALLLGADFGSAVVARVLLLPVEAAIPILLVVGVALFLRSDARGWKQGGRILTGLALALVSLGMIRAATAPLSGSPVVAMIVSYLEADPVSAFVLGAFLALLMHSSVAAVLMFVTMAAEGLLPLGAAAALVLGANLGSGVIAVMLTLSAPPAARRILVANLAIRGGLAALALGVLALAQPDLAMLGRLPADQLINLHLFFNLAVVLLALPFVRPVMEVATLAVPEPQHAAEASQLSALDARALADPDRALACAGREVLRMGEALYAMLTPAFGLYRDWSSETVRRIDVAEDEIDRMHFEVKLYIARLRKGPMDAAQTRRAMDLVNIANNIEEAADRVSTNLVGMARRMQSDGLNFSDAGWRDLTEFHDQVLADTQLALNILLTGDADSARQLLEEKDRVRQLEQQLQDRHIDRLRRGTAISIESSNLHQETLRALKQINSAISYVAYPIAEETGDLLSTRLSGGVRP
ncbi:Na/Pi cotransporter family protein [Sulfitobacter sp. LCG007]